MFAKFVNKIEMILINAIFDKIWSIKYQKWLKCVIEKVNSFDCPFEGSNWDKCKVI